MTQSTEQWCDSLLSVKMLENQPFFFSESPFYHPELSSDWCGFTGERLPHLLRMDDGLTLFLLFILLMAFVWLAGSKRLILHLTKRFFAPLRDQANLFDGDTKSERMSLRMLTSLNVFLPAIMLCDYILRQGELCFLRRNDAWFYFIFSILSFLLYYLLKRVATAVVDWSFFDKRQSRTCSESRDFLYAIQGILFFPLLFLSVYFELSIPDLLLYTLTLAVFEKVVLLYKYWTIFFAKTYGLLHFIVYFCALEIIPVFVLWRILAFVNSSFI